MKLSGILNIILGIALIGVCAFWFFSKQQETAPLLQSTADEPPSKEAIVLDNIMTRASVRAFKKDPIPDNDINVLLKAGMAAPTALNAQPWHFVVIRDRDMLRALADVSQYTGMLADAPLAIAVCGDMTKKATSDEGIYWLQDCCAATENILLAAHSMGLGATWLGGYPVESRYKQDIKVLKLPDNLIPVSIIAIGYPAVQVAPKDKWHPDNVSYEPEV